MAVGVDLSPNQSLGSHHVNEREDVMSRIWMIGLLLAPAIAALLGVYGLAATEPAEVTLEIDVYDFQDQWLEAAECARQPSARCIVLEDIQVFLLRTAL